LKYVDNIYLTQKNDMISETDMYSKDSEVQLVNMVQNTHT
jgi:hypothetical protein